MSKLVSITETAEAITTEASAYVWEEYDAPRKRIKRARIIEHRFTVSIPKATEEAAPVAFVVEHFPTMTLNRLEYVTGYDEPVRAYAGKFYAPVRMDYRHRHGESYPTESTDPRERITARIESISDVSAYDLEQYADMIKRHEVRADQWPATYYNVERIEDEARDIAARIIVINGEVWQECNEPVYVYSASSSWGWGANRRTTPAHIYATTDAERITRATYGALDRVAMNFYHSNVSRTAYINVIRPDLVTIDSTARDLAESSDRASREVSNAREQLEQLEKELAEARVNLEAKELAADKARAKCEQYAADPRAYWIARAGRYEDSKFTSIRRAAERIRRELSK